MANYTFHELEQFVRDVDLSTVTDDALVDHLMERSVSILRFIESGLLHFVNANFIGGFGDEYPEKDTCPDFILDDLSCEGDRPFKLAKFISLFWLCKRLCRKMCSQASVTSLLYHVLQLKLIYLHQYLMMDERSPKLKKEFTETISSCQELISDLKPDASNILIEFYVICAYLNVFYYEYETALNMALKCGEHLKLSVSFSGALGKRTRYQEKDVANLFVKIDRRDGDTSSDSSDDKESILPKTVHLDDDTLLNSIAFKENLEITSLTIPEQSFILLLCELHRRNHPRDEITTEQCLAYLNTILRLIYPDSKTPPMSRPTVQSSWPIATETLFRRSILEHTSVRRTERSVSQLEELANQFSRNEPPCSVRRSEHFFLTRMPSIWALQIEQARLLKKIGCFKSALDIFLLWDMWTEIIECYTHLQKREMAEQVIRARLDAGEKSAELYCALGDVTKNREHYLTAWEFSSHKSARAMRSLALTYMYIDKNYSKAIECFEKSLEINSLQAGLWFTFGCCCLQASENVKAERAFRQTVRLEPDNFEAWNNCASAVILQGRKSIALRLLKEACKHNYENWRIWENILIISTDVGAFSDSIHAYHRLLDLRQKHAEPIGLGIMVQAVVDDLPDARDEPSSCHRPKLLELFGRVTATTPTDPDIWHHYATLLLDEKPVLTDVTYQRAVQCLQSAHRCRIQPSQGAWEQNAKKREAIHRGLDALFNLLDQKYDPQTTDSMQAFIQSGFAALRLSINSVICQLKVALQSSLSTEDKESVKKICANLDKLLSRTVSKIKIPT